MKLYLVRHGEPNSPDIDPEKHLSKRGNLDAEALGKCLKERGVSISKIHHSGIMRAKETAEHLSRELSVSEVSKELKLTPNDSVKHWADLLETYDDDLMLVGHMPYMSIMIEHLTTGDRTHIFDTPEVACLERAKKGYWKLLWTLAP
ncbi:MAG: phosphohistidine phosphatase SixA [Bacteriovoracaceae bacterium]|nr:phosphohistidine phosphatase SixA [Bacteriovoracaceae bacterium]